MNTHSRYLLFLCLLPLLIIGCSNDEISAHSPKNIALFDTADLQFFSAKTYNTLTPWFNPFTEIEVKLLLVSPSGRRLTVPGFFDGDGAGGVRGRTFTVRVSPDEAGIWRWQVHSNLPEFKNTKGQFSVSDSPHEQFPHGPLSILKTDPTRFAFSDQSPHFLVGKFLDMDQPLPLRYSHTFFSEQWNDKQREAFLKHQLALGINKINIYLANKGDYQGIATTPWLGNASHNIKSRFDLHWWHQYEKWLKRFREEGIIVHLWFFADDSGFNLLTVTEREQLITYGMARLSGYVNTLFTLALEWQEDFSEIEIRKAGLLAQNHNPWNRLISVHSLSVTDNLEESTIFFGEDWLDFIEIQTGFINHHKINEFGRLYRRLENKPVILEEFSFGENNDEQRINTWSALLTAPAGIGTGSGLKAISKFLEIIEITAYTPATGLVTTDNAYSAISHDGQVIIYIFQNGPVLFSPGKINASKAQWFDPRIGKLVNSIFKFNADEPLVPPTNQDWILLITP
ncbi:MAG: DUF5060 domain-containing protein [Gammaproteobacteria bacterium]|nr:DUF5060 domain-containing protein [Gammaproteobacteria bacterium]